MDRTGFFYHPDFLRHLTGEGHPERPERLVSMLDYLQCHDIWADVKPMEFQPAEKSIIARIHPESYIANIENSCKMGYNYLDADTVVSENSFQVALEAVGAVVTAVDLVMQQKLDNAFCAVRPPGHHAEPGRSMGFCLFNNVAIAAKYAQEKYNLAKVCIIDWDVHHGNGTQAAFYKDPTVFYVSLHQSPLYPGTGKQDETGEESGRGYTQNFPLSAGAGNDDYLKIFKGELADRVLRFNPNIIFISAGFDAHKLDPLAGMDVTATGFADMTRVVKSFAEECCDGRLISTLEGGYHLAALKKSVVEHLKVLIN